MTTSESTEKKPLWLSIEENISALDSEELSGGSMEAAIQKIAGELDNAGYNVSGHGGNMIELRGAVSDAQKAGGSLMQDVTTMVESFTLEDVADPYTATSKLIDNIGKTWPKLKKSERRADMIQMVEQARLNLLIAKAKEMLDDTGIRYLIEEEVDFEVISGALDITDEKVQEVNSQIEAERAERERVAGLLEKVADKSNEEKVKHLFDNDVTEELIIEIAKIDQGVIDGVKKAMEEELKEKERLEAEAAAKKKAEAEGPALEDIAPEDMIDHIEAIREIMEFSDQEKEIRVMCEQSSIPKALVDIAVSEPDKLDELEKQAEG